MFWLDLSLSLFHAEHDERMLSSTQGVVLFVIHPFLGAPMLCTVAFAFGIAILVDGRWVRVTGRCTIRHSPISRRAGVMHGCVRFWE